VAFVGAAEVSDMILPHCSSLALGAVTGGTCACTSPSLPSLQSEWVASFYFHVAVLFLVGIAFGGTVSCSRGCLVGRSVSW